MKEKEIEHVNKPTMMCSIFFWKMKSMNFNITYFSTMASTTPSWLLSFISYMAFKTSRGSLNSVWSI